MFSAKMSMFPLHCQKNKNPHSLAHIQEHVSATIMESYKPMSPQNFVISIRIKRKMQVRHRIIQSETMARNYQMLIM